MLSGISGSRSCFPKKSLLEEIYDHIKNCDTMEYLWSQKTDGVAHTGVAVQFDLTPKFSIDFGGLAKTVAATTKVAVASASVASTGMSASVSPFSEKITSSMVRKITFEGRVTIKDFVSSQVKIKGKLVMLPLRSRAEKEKAIKVFNDIKDIDVGNYQVMTNNCRHYVIVIAAYLKTLSEFKEEQWKEFEEEMQKIMCKDNEKFQKCLSSCLYFLKQTINRLKDKSEADRNENKDCNFRKENFA